MTDFKYIGSYSKEDADSHMDVTWYLTFDCNYTCSYCNALYRNSSYALVNDKSISFIKNLFTNKKSKLILLGGEPTLHKDIELIVKTFSESARVEVHTNLGSSTNLYAKLLDYGAIINASWHGSKLFFDKLENLVGFKDKLYVSLMCMPDKLYKVKQVYTELASKGFAVDLLPLSSVKRKIDICYSDAEMEAIETINKQKNYYVEIDGKTEILASNKIDRTNFVNWKCLAGCTNLCILPNGDVFPCYYSCYSKPIHNIYSGAIFKPYPTFCKIKQCNHYEIPRSKVF